MSDSAYRRPERRTIYRVFFDEDPDGLIAADDSGNFLFANRQAAALTGYSPAELVGMTFDDLLPPDADPPDKAFHANAGLDVTERTRIGVIRKDRSRFPAEVTLTLRPDGTRLYSLRDVTEQARVETISQALQDQLFNIIEFLPDATFVVDQDSRVVAWNRACELMTGVGKKELLGEGDFAYAEPFYGIRRPILIDQLDCPAELEAQYRNVRRSGATVYAETFAPLLRNREGAHLWLGAAPLFDQEGRRSGAIEVVRDITEQKRIEQALRESELKYRALFEGAGDAILLIHGARFADCNVKAEELYGCSREQLLGAHPFDFSPPVQPDGRSSREAALEKMALAVSQGAQSFEWQHCRQDGTPFLAEVSLTCIELDNHTMLQAIVRDITERKKAEEALRQSESTLRSVFGAAPVGICILKDRMQLAPNRYWYEGFGYTKDEVVGKSTRMLFPSDNEFERVGRELYAVLNDHGMSSLTATMRRRDGSLRDVILTAAPIQKNDPSAGTVGIIHDVTELKEAERQVHRLHKELQRHALELERRVVERTAELAEARDRAEESDRLKSAFLATMSHELRTPLNAIIGFTGILLMGLVGPLNDEQKKQLSLVQGSSRHLLDLISEVLDISKIESGQFQLALEKIDMRAAIQDSIHKVMPMAEKKKLLLSLSIAPEVHQAIGDRRRVEQVLINLLSNAVKFTEQGEIRVESRIDGEWLVTRVMDTGIGIAPEDVDTLFKPFRQIDSGLARQYEGTGLGLSISKRLAEAMGGRIEVKSEKDRGSCFAFALPIERTGT